MPSIVWWQIRRGLVAFEPDELATVSKRTGALLDAVVGLSALPLSSWFSEQLVF